MLVFFQSELIKVAMRLFASTTGYRNKPYVAEAAAALAAREQTRFGFRTR